MKTAIICVSLVVFTSAFADSPSPEVRSKALQEARARREATLAKKGGIVELANSLKGKVLFIDTQKKADLEASLGEVIKKFSGHLKVNVAYKKDEFTDPDALRKSNGCDFAIIFVDQADKPATIVAPEERWAVVNVARYDKGLKSIQSRKDVYDARCAKAGLKALLLLCGGGGSRFQGHVAAATKIEDLDLAHNEIPYDLQGAVKSYLKACGVTPRLLTTYERACQEGWAPAPTNDVQKAIWDKVHEIPKNPMKIEFDPKKGR